MVGPAVAAVGDPGEGVGCGCDTPDLAESPALRNKGGVGAGDGRFVLIDDGRDAAPQDELGGGGADARKPTMCGGVCTLQLAPPRFGLSRPSGSLCEDFTESIDTEVTEFG